MGYLNIGGVALNGYNILDFRIVDEKHLHQTKALHQSKIIIAA
jgi:hypothetical protein